MLPSQLSHLSPNQSRLTGLVSHCIAGLKIAYIIIYGQKTGFAFSPVIDLSVVIHKYLVMQAYDGATDPHQRNPCSEGIVEESNENHPCRSAHSQTHEHPDPIV